MRRTITIACRELAGYFTAPLTYGLLIVFAALATALTFVVGRFFARGEADLQPFFLFHPWLYIGLAPALSMRLWTEEKASGTIELLLTLPARLSEAVIGKFLAAWGVAAVALALTVPLWLTVNLLGQPDNGVILAGYLASWLMAGALLAIGEAVSAASRGPLTAFVATAAIAALLTASGSASALELLRAQAPAPLLSALAHASLFDHFAALTRGLIELPDLVYFASLIVASLAATVVIVDLTKAE
jgi:gliding motility-associated transport system permease protein